MKIESKEQGVSKRKQQAIATREKIFNAAFRLITEKGFDNVTVDEICTESGVAKGSFYHYFKSKDDIVIETYMIIDKKYSDEVYDLPSDMNSFDKILATVGFQAKYAHNKGIEFVRQIYKSQLESGTDFFISEERPYFKILREIIEEGMEKGEIKPELSAVELTRWIISFSRGVTYDWCLHSGDYDIVAVMDRAFRMTLGNFRKS
ncbi:MAG TPA: TetR/AcrR family transcriptional regulator [Spirochaetota bacterium]|nr:TetR/AcrR family transcriptional regulator [Spirochaetota bacterium]HPJ34690.1 TetR/AcrR family transcriptional regulator [Spirochaetota bacterium]